MNKNFLKYMAALLLFGSNAVAAHYISLSSRETVFMRSFLGCIVLTASFFATKHHISAFKFKKDLLFIFLSGVAMAADWLFLFEVYDRIGASLSMIINYCGPAIVIIFSILFLKENFTVSSVIALISALLGAVFISGTAVKGGSDIFGFFCTIMSAFSYAAMLLFSRSAKNISGTENSVLQLFFTFVTTAVFLFFKQGLAIHIPQNDIIPVLWLGIINTGLGCFLYFSSIGKLPVLTVSVCGYAEPLSAVIFSALILHEILLPLQILGAVLIIGGAVLSEFIKKA